MSNPVFKSGLQFDPAKPLHGLVMAYLAQLHGFIELASRGILTFLKTKSDREVEAFLAGGVDPAVRSLFEAGRGGRITPLLGKQKPLARVGPNDLEVDIEALSKSIALDHGPALKHFNRLSAGSLLILAWDHTEAYHTHEPLWEFHRHTRNAAAHGGRFTFKHGEPLRKAAWRTLGIVAALEGTSLFYDEPDAGFLGIGDVLYLLHDLEPLI
jgi:hypothetical protein